MLASANQIFHSAAPLKVTFAGAPRAESPSVLIPCPWLAGASSEELFEGARETGFEDGIRLFQRDGLLLGHARETFDARRLSALTQGLYARILRATRQHHLYRVWNYVPEINVLTDGLENYRAFCQGRSLAFEAALGAGFQPQLPAASAVGSAGQVIDVVFAAGRVAPLHCENPEQVPAYHYPTEHGPRPPSFSRATVAREGRQTLAFISGTAAIKGHQTIAPHSLPEQLACTLDNLRIISRIAGLGPDLAAGSATARHFKVYLRHPADLSATRAELERSLLRPRDIVTYLHADICRAALDLEIEATLTTA